MRKSVKILLLTLCMAIMMCAVSGCGGTEQNNASAAEENVNTVGSGSIEPESSEDKSTVNESDADSNPAENTDNENSSNILVAYFSATGTTKGIAENIAGILSADMYEIVPKEPYSSEDLDYNDNSSRSSIEMNDESARPEISNAIENIGDYDVIFLGYPIWWGKAPKIMYTFVESYDLSGKTVIPFCTSGSSGIGSSAENLEKLSPSNWLDGRRFSGSASSEEISQWLSSIEEIK